MMKVEALSSRCVSIRTPKTNSYNGKTLYSQGNASKFVSKSLDADKTLQKTYCLSSLSFLACLLGVYAVSSYFSGAAKAASGNFLRMI